MDFVLLTVTLLCIGFVLGFLFCMFLHKTDGSFIVEDSGEDVQVWTLNMKIMPEEILKKKQIYLKVDVKK